MATKKKKGANPLAVGHSVLIRTVTHYHTGRIVELSASDVVLEDAAWIADTGRFGEALKSGTLSEVEPFPDPVCVSRSAIIDVTLWKHELPRASK